MELDQDVWIRFLADDYAATLPARAVLDATTPGSYLTTLIEFELTKGLAEPSIRLNCSVEEAKEVVAAIRRGSSYEPPADDSRLFSGLKQTFDYLGLPTNNFPSTKATQEVLLVPSYYIGCQQVGEDACPSLFGVLLYSSSAQGWANRAKDQDTRPQHMRSQIDYGQMGNSYLAAVLRSESTGAGEDLIYMLPNEYGSEDFTAIPYNPVLLHSNLQASTFATPPLHRNTGGAAMTAANGKLYLCGGFRGWTAGDDMVSDGPRPGVLEVYDPHIDTWFAAAAPVPRYSLKNHVLVTNKQEGMLLALGGMSFGETEHIHVVDTTWAQIGMYDIKAGKWTLNPSGCTWSVSATRYDPTIAAAAADDYTVVILKPNDVAAQVAAAAPDAAAAAAADMEASCQVDLLDLRMWRFRSGAALQRHHPYGISLVDFDGKVVAIGGSEGLHPSDDYGARSTAAVSAYNVSTDTWCEMPDLPFTLSHASPVVMRMPSVLSGR